METTRKDFEKPVTYKTVGYRIQHGGKWFVDKYANRMEENPGYGIRTRTMARDALRQFIWSEHKNNGYTHDIADFYIEGRGFYES